MPNDDQPSPVQEAEAVAPKPRYSQPRTLIQWVRHPYLAAAKVAATLLHEDGLRGKALAAAVRKVCPDIEIVAGVPISDRAIVQRGDKGDRYDREHYTASVETILLAERLRACIAAGKPWRRVIRH